MGESMDYRFYHLQLQKKIEERTHISGYDIFLDLRDVRETMIEPEIVPPVPYGEFWEEFSQGLIVPRKPYVDVMGGVYDRSLGFVDLLGPVETIDDLTRLHDGIKDSTGFNITETLLALFGHRHVSEEAYDGLQRRVHRLILDGVFGN